MGWGVLDCFHSVDASNGANSIPFVLAELTSIWIGAWVRDEVAKATACCGSCGAVVQGKHFQSALPGAAGLFQVAEAVTLAGHLLVGVERHP